MQLIALNPKIQYFDTFADFSAEFKVDERDMILTEKIINDNYISKMNCPAQIMVRDDYEVGEPTDTAINKMLQTLSEKDYNRLIAIGGGSVLDTAKALVMEDAYPLAHLIGKFGIPNSHELITVPTTCGTGAEVSTGGIYLMEKDGLKTAIVGSGATYAVLIPEFIENLPFKIFFLSSMDALSHAIEGWLYSDDVVNEFGLALARQAITQILECQAALYKNGVDYRKQILRKFLTASTMGNMALTANGANMVHAMAYPPAEKFHMSHGESVYQFLIPVLQLYQKQCPDSERFVQLKEMIIPIVTRAGFPCDDANVFTQLEKLLNAVFPLRTMGEVGMTEEDIEPFSKNIVETKQRLLTKAYITVDQEMVAWMYRERL